MWRYDESYVEIRLFTISYYVDTTLYQFTGAGQPGHLESGNQSATQCGRKHAYN